MGASTVAVVAAVVLSLVDAVVEVGGAAAAAAALLDPNGALVVRAVAAGPPATLGLPVGEAPLELVARAASRSLRSLSAASCLAWLEAVCRTAVDEVGREAVAEGWAGATDERRRADERF